MWIGGCERGEAETVQSNATQKGARSAKKKIGGLRAEAVGREKCGDEVSRSLVIITNIDELYR